MRNNQFFNGYILRNYDIDAFKSNLKFVKEHLSKDAEQILKEDLSNAYLASLDIMTPYTSDKTIFEQLNDYYHNQIEIKDFVSEKNFDIDFDVFYKKVDDDILMYVSSYKKDLVKKFEELIIPEKLYYHAELRKPIGMSKSDWEKRKEYLEKAESLEYPYNGFSRIHLLKNPKNAIEDFTFDDLRKKTIKERKESFIDYNLQTLIVEELYPHVETIELNVFNKIKSDMRTGVFEEEKEALKEIFEKNALSLTKENFKTLQNINLSIKNTEKMKPLIKTLKEKINKREYIKGVDVFSIPKRRKPTGYVPF